MKVCLGYFCNFPKSSEMRLNKYFGIGKPAECPYGAGSQIDKEHLLQAYYHTKSLP